MILKKMEKDLIFKFNSLNITNYKYHHIYLCKNKRCEICSIIICKYKNPYHYLYKKCNLCNSKS
jgi:hypothetical protein